MGSFMVSAPGKVILFGEYAAVYGRPAIAAAIGLRSYLLVTPGLTSERLISLECLDTGLYFTWRVEDLPWSAAQHASNVNSPKNDLSALDPDLLRAIQLHCIKNPTTSASSGYRNEHLSTALAFLYLYLSLSSPQTPGASYTIRSRLPIGAGLGSSASFSVCVAAGILIQAGIIQKNFYDFPSLLVQPQVDLIENWAFVAELFFHGTPSGVDTSTSCRGGALFFQRSYWSSNPATVTSLARFPQVPSLLVDTCHARSTATVAEAFKQLTACFPEPVHCILNYIQILTGLAGEIVESFDSEEGPVKTIERLGQLVHINHGLLVSLGAGHPRLDRVHSIIKEEKLGWTKLTGAGCGGCALSVLQPKIQVAALQKTTDRLSSEGFQVYKTLLAGNGLGVLLPGSLEDDGACVTRSTKVEGRDVLHKIDPHDIEETFEGVWRGRWSYWREGTE